MKSFSLAALAALLSPVSAIIGGHPIVNSNLSYVLAIHQPAASYARSYPTFICNSILISPGYALTSTECLVSLKPRDIIVRYGVPKQPENKVEVSQIIPMQELNFTIASYEQQDLTVLKLATNITSIQPAPLVLTPPEVGDTKLRIVGWGSTRNNTAAKDVNLNAVRVNRISPDECNARLSQCNTTIDRAAVLCTSSTASGASGFGDAGGPVIDSKSRVLGIMVGQPDCAASQSLAIKLKLSQKDVAAWLRNYV